MGFKQRTAQRDEGGDHSHLRVAGSRGLARHLGCPLSPSASGIIGALDWSWSRCSRVCLHAQHQRTFLIVGLATQLDYCRCSGWGGGAGEAPSWLLGASGALWVPPTATKAAFRLPTSTFTSFLRDQQGTAGLVRPSLARPSFIVSCSHCYCVQNCLPASPLLLRPLVSSRGRASLQPWQAGRQAGPSHSSTAGFAIEVKARGISCCCKEQTSCFFF